jgi:hypothetical protein
VRQARRRDEVAKLEAELEEVRPFLDLAREIHDEVARAAASDGAPVETLVEAIDAIPKRERIAVARAIFDQLPPDRQWAIIEHVFGDEEIRAALDADHQTRLEASRRAVAAGGLIAKARLDRRLDTREVPSSELLTLGLFRETDVHDAIDRGHEAATCARRVVLRATTDPGAFQVIEDVFNPEGGFFVTGYYDESTWRTHDRLPAHAIVRAGSITDETGSRAFEPVLHLGGRADFERAGEPIEGRLHLGYLLIGDADVFAKGKATPWTT